MDGDQGAINHLKNGDVLTAINDVYRTVRNRILGIPDELQKFETLIFGTPLGKDAYQIAKDFYQDWQDGDDAEQAALKAIEKNGAQVTTDLVNLVANWLGLMDRTDTQPVPSADATAKPAS